MVRHLIDKINLLDAKISDNSNITNDHLGIKGLHLNGRGTGRLAMNIISFMTQLWQFNEPTSHTEAEI